jgi:hypothetical protein
MYALARKNGHIVWREQWYALTSGISLQFDLYMTRKDQVFIANVVVIDQTWEIVPSNVISQPLSATAKLVSLLISTSIEGFIRGTTLF